MKEIENTILAMTEWLEENTDGCFMIVTKGDDSMCAVNCKDPKLLLKSLVSGMVKVPELKELMSRALGIAMAIDIEKKTKQRHNDNPT